MILPDAPWRTRAGMGRLLRTLDAKAGETRFVGGCVRDTLLGFEVSDVDLATRLAPEEVMRRLDRAGIKAVPTGLAHGTVTAVIHGRPVEVTTLRKDVATDGRRATIAYTEDWREDAARRDFTINALSADPGSGELFDYFGGLADLKTAHVRFIGDPLVRIAEDHLRILRFFRFHARFGRGAPDADGLAACAARANDLMALSRERIADELLKLLAMPDPVATVRLMIERGILKPVLPEIDEGGIARIAALVRREKHACVAPDPVRRLSALLPRNQPMVAADIAARLRLSNVKRMRLIQTGEAYGLTLHDPLALAYKYNLEVAIDRLLLDKTLTADQAAEAVKRLDDWKRPKLPVSGGDLIAMGLEEGPIVARTMQAIEREWVNLGFSADRKEVRALARRHVDQALRERQ
ncbi:MAG: CCA tRNA nucleotidyltransferase [Sphingosinicella sp.]|uniref:CCA tRNA nucleotidyltransferase n=1 Tax=Sphingosinicella sp. TaxID=1917971 RepID=UPI0040384289